MIRPTDVVEFDVSNVSEVAPLLSLSPVETEMLATGHPFLRFGEWRGFAAHTGGVLVERVVASIDSRQRTGRDSIGCLGFIRVLDAVDVVGPKTSGRAMAAAIAWLRRRRIGLVRGPVDFSTWYGHRAITEDVPDSGGPRAFPLEPRHGRSVVALLRSGGFLPVHRAVSYIVDSRAVIDSATHARARLDRAGLRDRPLCMPQLDDELRLVHELSTEIFRSSWGFSDISLDEFDSMYRPLAPLLDPELVRILETPDGTAIGFAFAIPGNPRQGPSGGFIVKTLGIRDDALSRYPGVGAGLTSLVHEAATEQGYLGGIHALMAHGSMAHRLSSRWGRLLRSYATFERAIR